MTTKIRQLLESTDDVELFSLSGKNTIAKIVSVYDGDTCKANLFLGDDKIYKFTIRVSGYDSPEMKTKDPTEKKFAERSKNCLEKMVLGKLVKLNCQEFDKYGRVLGEIFIKKSDDTILCINNFMISNHLGYPYEGEKKLLFTELYNNGYYKEGDIDIPTTVHFEDLTLI